MPSLDVRVAELDIQKKEGISWGLEQQISKVHEELGEVAQAKTPEDTVREALDLLQASMGVLNMAVEKLEGDMTLKKLNKEHLQKLHERGWTFKNILHIQAEK